MPHEPSRNLAAVSSSIGAVLHGRAGVGSDPGHPLYWQLVDCSFGVFGFLPLRLCRCYVRELETLEN